ncbi:MAG: PGN_0703 family putative restriction endonuclease, partial [Acidimicrobiia bacterium]
MSPAPVHASPEVALLPAAQPVFAELVARGLDHRWAMHHRSSQAFALNLFAPLDEPQVRAALALVDLEVASVAPIEFEYSDPEDRLGEIRPASPHRTQVDVVLRGTSAAGERLVALIEVKFTEVDFGHCSAYDSPANPRRDVCRSAGLFGGQPAGCFQLANHGDGHRTYHEHLAEAPVVQPSGADDPGGCLVRRSLNQPMRNLALAHLLLKAGEADRVSYT